jgi:hypothetical protein
MRTFCAFLVAPLPGIVMVALYALTIGLVDDIVPGLLGVLVFSWMLQIFPGIPIAALLHRWRSQFWWAYALAGMAIYVLAAAGCLTWLVHSLDLTSIRFYGGVFAFLLFGALSGITFWLVARPALRRASGQIQIDELRARFE